MLIFGHLGTTLGTAKLLEGISFEVPIDYRLVMLGAMLPDIIDKPLVLMTTYKPVGSARLAAHSLIFIIALFLAGHICSLLFNKRGLLIIAYGSFAHIVEDMIWRDPKVFFWPYYNWLIGRIKVSRPVISSGYLESRVKIITASMSKIDLLQILKKPSVFIPEIIGGIILLYFIAALIANKKVGCFLKTGRLKY